VQKQNSSKCARNVQRQTTGDQDYFTFCVGCRQAVEAAGLPPTFARRPCA